MVQSHTEDVQGLCASLLSLLGTECGLYGQLKTVLHEERRTLTKGSTGDIFLSNKNKGSLVERIENSQTQRMEIVGALAQCLDIEERDVTLTKLSALADAAQKNALMAMQKELTALGTEVRMLNSKNRDLLQFSLAVVRDLLDFISHAVSCQAGYAVTGQANNSSIGGRLLQKEG